MHSLLLGGGANPCRRLFAAPAPAQVPEEYRAILLQGLGLTYGTNALAAFYARGIAEAKQEPAAFWMVRRDRHSALQASTLEIIYDIIDCIMASRKFDEKMFAYDGPRELETSANKSNKIVMAPHRRRPSCWAAWPWTSWPRRCRSRSRRTSSASRPSGGTPERGPVRAHASPLYYTARH